MIIIWSLSSPIYLWALFVYFSKYKKMVEGMLFAWKFRIFVNCYSVSISFKMEDLMIAHKKISLSDILNSCFV